MTKDGSQTGIGAVRSHQAEVAACCRVAGSRRGVGLTAHVGKGRRRPVESTVQITLNGECRELPGPVTVTELLNDLGLRAGGRRGQ
jgi:hypothetical protein